MAAAAACRLTGPLPLQAHSGWTEWPCKRLMPAWASISVERPLANLTEKAQFAIYGSSPRGGAIQLDALRAAA